MKNVLKFAFLGLVMTVAFASCNNSEKKGTEGADSLALDSANTAVDSANVALDSAKTAVDSAKTAVDSVKAAH